MYKPLVYPTLPGVGLKAILRSTLTPIPEGTLPHTQEKGMLQRGQEESEQTGLTGPPPQSPTLPRWLCLTTFRKDNSLQVVPSSDQSLPGHVKQ